MGGEIVEFVFDNTIPIYIQLLDYLKIYLISGVFKSGEKLPSVREFATTFKVNPNTMQKALSELESMKLIYTERTNGKFVTEDKELIEKLKDEYALTLAKSYFQGMKRIGLGKAESIKYLERIDE
ncbi:MAG TPA: GntR family transcriptional regulator [Clostridiales bacterium]|nr:GntR family transcriptional regulator [Clostridiales bacterium]